MTETYELDSSSTQRSPADAVLNKSESTEDENFPHAFTGAPADLEKAAAERLRIEAGGDELSRYELNAHASRELSRILTDADKLMEKANDTDEPLPVMGGDRPYPPPVTNPELYVVSYDGPDDPLHPHNWPLRKKIIACFVVAMLALTSSVSSAIFAESNGDLSKKFHVGPVVATLGTSLYVFGFASGPVVWGPLSELYGRKIVLVASIFGFICFSFAVATGENIQTILICRFFAGFIGGAPMVVAPAALADLFGTATRGKVMAIFAMVIFGGPMLGPIFGGFTVKNHLLGWRWTSYFSGLMGVLAIIGVAFFYEETHHPIILVRKAEVLRRRTGNFAIHAPHEEISLSIKEICEKNITRPIVMLFIEPILFFITLYNAFIYGLLYLMLTAIPMVFQGRYGFIPGVAELPYLSMLIGIVLGGATCIYFEGRFEKKMIANNGKPIPEERLPAMMVGGFFFAVGLFWFGWTGDFPDTIHWIVPAISLAFIGFGLISIFMPCLNYIIDCYLYFAASALAGNTFLRSAFGGAFPLFARQMFTAMKIKYAGTLLGCVAVVMIPVPFLFYRYGSWLRSRSKYAFDL